MNPLGDKILTSQAIASQPADIAPIFPVPPMRAPPETTPDPALILTLYSGPKAKRELSVVVLPRTWV
jgi:hypothetical protein